MRSETLRMRVRASVMAVGLVTGVTALAVATASATAATPTPNMSRPATDNNNFVDILTAIGYPPTCVGTADGVPIQQFVNAPVAAADAKATIYANDPLDAEQAAACHPSVILTVNSESPTTGSTADGAAYGQIAPTIYAATENGCYSYTEASLAADGNPTGACFTDWKKWASLVGAALGPSYDARINTVIASLDRRSAALRGQVAGKSIAVMNIFPSTSSFNVYNQNFPFVNAIVRDLGMNELALPASDYPANCSGTTGFCATNTLSLEDLSLLDPSDVLLVETLSNSASSVQAAEQNPLFDEIPAVHAGRVEQDTFLSENGPLAVGGNESMIERALSIKEYNASLTSGSGPYTHLSLTYDPTGRKLCWAVNPPAGKQPSGALTLSLSGSDKPVTLTLSKAPRYATSEAASSGWNTDPATYLASGCDTLSAKDAGLWSKEASKVTATLGAGTATGKLAAGAASIFYSSLPKVTKQLKPKTVRAGHNARFQVEGTGLPTPTISWQYSDDHGQTWQTIPGAHGDRRTVGKLSLKVSGRLYRAELVNTAGITLSKAVTLTVKHR